MNQKTKYNKKINKIIRGIKKKAINIAIFGIGFYLLPANIVFAESLTQALRDYCVPVSGYCTSKAVYVEFPGSGGGCGGGCGFCRCSSISKYYDEKGSRSCRDCITGSFASNDYKRCEPIVCPAGYEAKL
ncbi:MAG: hypothetical protein ACI4N3_05315, partial [Alphaproteobacteria bacterium]